MMTASLPMQLRLRGRPLLPSSLTLADFHVQSFDQLDFCVEGASGLLGGSMLSSRGPASAASSHVIHHRGAPSRTVSSFEQSFELKVEESSREVCKQQRYLDLLIDTSGSMHDKVDATCEGVKAIAEQLHPHADLVAMRTFASTSRQMFKFMNAKEVDWERCKKSVTKAVGFGGSTALFDAIHESLQQYQDPAHNPKALKNKLGADIVRWIVAVTDGEDNQSKINVHDLADKLSQPGVANFNVIIMLVGKCEAANRQLDVLQQSAQHVHVLKCESDATSISRMFRQTVKIITSHQISLKQSKHVNGRLVNSNQVVVKNADDAQLAQLMRGLNLPALLSSASSASSHAPMLQHHPHRPALASSSSTSSNASISRPQRGPKKSHPAHHHASSASASSSPSKCAHHLSNAKRGPPKLVPGDFTN